MSEKYCYMTLRLNIDCNSCCRKDVENYLIDQQQQRVYVCGKFVPSNLAIKIGKKMNVRVEILEVEEFGAENDNEQNTENPPMMVEERPSIVEYPGQVPSMHSTMPMAYSKGGYFAVGF